MIVQGSAEWLAQKYGNASASRIKDIVATTKSGYAASRDNYMTELVLERFGVFKEPFSTPAMQRGNDEEPFARATYEEKEGKMVEQCGYVLHPVIKHSGASPDGLVDEDGLLEIKCPDTKTHFEYLLKGVPPAAYIPQMAWQQACTGKKWTSFVSYDSRAPEGLQYFHVIYHRDEKYIAELEAEVEKFLIELDAKVVQLKVKLDELKGAS